jgi:hypothetical protein
MFDYGWLNIGSLALGLISWSIPIAVLLKAKKSKLYEGITLSIISLGACAISLFFQILYNQYLVKIEDWAALMDTMGGVVVASGVLIFVTILLNTLTLLAYRSKAIK